MAKGMSDIVGVGIGLVVGVIMAVFVNDVVQAHLSEFSGIGATVLEYVTPLFVILLFAYLGREML